MIDDIVQLTTNSETLSIDPPHGEVLRDRSLLVPHQFVANSQFLH